MPKKRKSTPTQRNIAAINRYVSKIADTFGTVSRQYEEATAALYQFDIRTNKHGVIQVRNTAANRKKHSTIRSIKNRRPKVQRLVKESEKAMAKYNAKVRKKETFTSIKAFEKAQKETADKENAIYDMYEIANSLGIEFSIYNAFKDDAYFDDRRTEIVQAMYEQQGDENVSRETEVITDESGNAVLVDKETGEILYVYGD